MTAKEKAKEFYNKFLPLVQGGHLNETYHNKAKQCAIIAIDGVISELEDVEFNHDVILGVDISYFESIKHEIEKL